MRENLCKCNDCRRVYFSDELRHDTFNGGDIGESHWSCPYCGGDNFEEIYECARCGHYVEEAFGCVGSMLCEECFAEVADVRTVVEYGKDNPAEVKINGLFACVYDEDEINEILLADFMKLPEKKQREWTDDYVSADKSDFADWYDRGGEA